MIPFHAIQCANFKTKLLRSSTDWIAPQIMFIKNNWWLLFHSGQVDRSNSKNPYNTLGGTTSTPSCETSTGPNRIFFPMTSTPSLSAFVFQSTSRRHRPSRVFRGGLYPNPPISGASFARESSANTWTLIMENSDGWSCPISPDNLGRIQERYLYCKKVYISTKYAITNNGKGCTSGNESGVWDNVVSSVYKSSNAIAGFGSLTMNAWPPVLGSFEPGSLCWIKRCSYNRCAIETFSACEPRSDCLRCGGKDPWWHCWLDRLCHRRRL